MENTQGGFAAVVLIDTLDNQVLVVVNPTEETPKDKLPGGTGERGDWEIAEHMNRGDRSFEELAAEMCARRETLEESGLDLNRYHPHPLTLVRKELRGKGPGKHWFWIFRASISDVAQNIDLPPQGRSGETPRFVHAGDIPAMGRFLSGQLDSIRDTLNEIVWRDTTLSGS